MKRMLRRTILAIILISACGTYTSVSAQDAAIRGRNVTVSGEGNISVIPDQATIRFGVVTLDLDPETARSDNAEVSAATLNVIREMGVEDSDIQVNVLRIQPYTEYDPDLRRNVDRGYQAVREMTVVLNDLEMLPEAISRIVGEGANRLNGITYGLQDDEEASMEALQKALLNARRKAELMAETLGARLGLVMQITEQGIVQPQPIFMQYERAAALKDAGVDANPDAFASGEIEVTANVTVVFSLLPPR